MLQEDLTSGRPVPSKHVGVEADPSCPGCAAAALQPIMYQLAAESASNSNHSDGKGVS